jgi:hypothetical protein
MTTLRVWAPIPTKVAGQSGADHIPIKAQEDNCWSVDLPAAHPPQGIPHLVEVAG